MFEAPRPRGRPAGQLTRRRRDGLRYVLSRIEQGDPIVIGQMTRMCGFNCRQDAKRVLRDLRDMGLIPN